MKRLTWALTILGMLAGPACGGSDDSQPDAADGDAGEIGEGGPDADDGTTMEVDADVDIGGDDGPGTEADVGGDVDDEGAAEGDGDADGGAACTIGGGECAAGEVCDVAGCDPTTAGTCVARPDACAEVFAPVCGCDGVTYSNDCERLVAGEALDHAGVCSSGDTCGGISGTPCTDPEVCDLESCAPDVAGTCLLPPDACPEVWEPVCGCDGETYSNDCERLGAGAAPDHAGACSSGDTCGGIAGTPCTAPEVCDVRGCGADLTGTCVAPTDPGACPDVMLPVCGCDGTTYENECLRLAAGAALDHDGACAGADCTPTCVEGGGGNTFWDVPCTSTRVCRSEDTCTGCTVTCEQVGTTLEGWYATCADTAIDPSCRGETGGLILLTDCSP